MDSKPQGTPAASEQQDVEMNDESPPSAPQTQTGAAAAVDESNLTKEQAQKKLDELR